MEAPATTTRLRPLSLTYVGDVQGFCEQTPKRGPTTFRVTGDDDQRPA